MDHSFSSALQRQNGMLIEILFNYYLSKLSKLFIGLIFLSFYLRLDGKHVVFGQVTEGIDTVSLMESYGLHDGGTVKKIVITDCGELKWLF